jgi:diaminopimelate epimerase
MVTEIRVRFQKLHGLGNDFVVADARGLPRSLSPLARAITHRNTGVGADGFLVVLPPTGRAHDARVRFFNADGSEPEMSGNGIRCVGGFLMSESGAKRELAIETKAGLKTLRLVSSQRGRWIFRVSMGAPILEARHIPFRAGSARSPVVNFPLRLPLEVNLNATRIFPSAPTSSLSGSFPGGASQSASGSGAWAKPSRPGPGRAGPSSLLFSTD